MKKSVFLVFAGIILITILSFTTSLGVLWGDDKLRNNYVNNEHNFSLFLPYELFRDGALYIFKEYEPEDGAVDKVVFQYSEITDEENHLETNVVLFKIHIYDKKYPTPKGDVLYRTDKYIYTFVNPNENQTFDSVSEQELYEKFAPLLYVIENSFTYIK